VLADMDWNEMDIPLSRDPILPLRCGLSPGNTHPNSFSNS